MILLGRCLGDRRSLWLRSARNAGNSTCGRNTNEATGGRDQERGATGLRRGATVGGLMGGKCCAIHSLPHLRQTFAVNIQEVGTCRS